MIRNLTALCRTALVCIAFFSCQEKDEAIDTSYIRKYWNETASSNYEVPVTRTAPVTAKYFLNLMTNHVFYFDILVDTAFKEDELTGAALYSGTAASQGTLLADLQPAIDGRHLSGNVQLTEEQATLLMAEPVFLNVSSKLSPAGLVRLQMDKNIDFYADIPLTGMAVVPAVSTTAAGKVVLRITTDKVLHYQVFVSGLETGDVWQEAHLHAGATGANGAAQYTLISTAADYNNPKSASGLADAILTLIKTGTGYIDVHSANHAGGLLRGQIR